MNSAILRSQHRDKSSVVEWHLLSLLDEGLSEELPGDVLHDTTGLFQALVYRHCAHLPHSTTHQSALLVFLSFAQAEGCSGN